MKRLSIIFAVAAVVGVWPAVSGAATFKGVVVAKQRGALLVASPAGVVRSVAGSAAIGSRVVLAGDRARVVGHTNVARVRGIVVRRVGATVFLSSNRHLVAVHSAAAPATTTPPTTGMTHPPITLPGSGAVTGGGAVTGSAQPGDVVSSQVTIQNGELDEDSSQSIGHSSASALEVQALVSAVGSGTVTLTVGTQTLTIPLPAGLTLPDSMVGQTVTLSVSLGGQVAGGGDDDSGDDNGGDNGGSGGGNDD